MNTLGGVQCCQSNHDWICRLDCCTYRSSVRPWTQKWSPGVMLFPVTSTILKSQQSLIVCQQRKPIGSSVIQPVINAVSSPATNTGRPVKVIGLGNRASSAVQLCLESPQLSSAADLWISSGDTTNEQSFLMLNKEDSKASNGKEPYEAPIVILVLGMGANFGEDEALNILRTSREYGSLFVMIVIQPFNFEGPRRRKEIEMLAQSLLDDVDLCFVIQHDALFKREKVTLAEALRMADNTVLHAIKAVSNLCLGGDQVKLFNAPREGLKEITTNEILSILQRAGNAWVGFGSSFSVKSAVQRAAFESPFLQGLIPGVKGLVACTISSAEEIGWKDLQYALHTLRCSIGPRAQLVCTSVKDPTLRQGAIVATVLLTRNEREGSFSLSLDENSGVYSSSINGREIRKSLESPADIPEVNYNSSRTQEPKDPTSNNGDGSGVDQRDESTLGRDPDVQTDSYAGLNEVVMEGNGAVRVISEEHFESRTQISDKHIRSSGNSEEPRPEFNAVIPETSDNTVLDSFQVEASEPEVETTVNDVVNNPQKYNFWKLFKSPSLIDRGKPTTNEDRKCFFGWEAGPNSAAAEAWARARSKLENLGSLDRNGANKVAFGIRPVDDTKSESVKQDKQPDSVYEATMSDLTGPLSRVLSSSLDAVTDFYNAAYAKVFKKQEDEESRQISSFLSERAASMLEAERTSMELPPMMEMKYKNGIYKGRCNGGLPEGKGRLSFANGSFYDGMWKQGKRVGIGSFYYANGDVFQGNWRNDQMHGKGWFYFHTGERLYADFWKGKANGEGRCYSSKGDVFFGHFRDGWRHGKSLSIENGVRWSEVWEHGVLISRRLLEDAEMN